MIEPTEKEDPPLPILFNLEKKIVLVLGTDLDFYKELTRFSAKDIKIELNEYY